MNINNSLWQPAPSCLSLSPHDVHLWRIQLVRTETELQDLRDVLSSDEITRALRFRFEKDRQRFIAGRGILRKILGRYLGVDAQAVKFAYEPRGKPLLAETFALHNISFNLSHSEDLALCVVSSIQNVGVDLEFIRAIDDVESFAKRFFTDNEYKGIKLLAVGQQQKMFFRYWTCKEAYLKATGVGIGELEMIEVSLTPDCARIVIDQTNQMDKQWSLIEVVLDNNYVAATAVSSSQANFMYWQY
ncbi:MAG: 4'-phosphopantetheinyl transferase superfamily protein [Calothrix sp. FI2-JRJ7]|jgi:4'-phosphopantetheinyl transferase|nr:4'-phosphopantetheinyl transferase superfamily protein [Calothrix sp. FI2-JRJ7]